MFINTYTFNIFNDTLFKSSVITDLCIFGLSHSEKDMLNHPLNFYEVVLL